MESNDATESAPPMAADEPTRPGAPLRLSSILFWQAFAVVCGVAGLLFLDRGAPTSLVLGAALMTGSLMLSRQAFFFATRNQKRPYLSMLFFFLKLALFLGLAMFGLSGQLLGAMSFAAGATTLPMAIVADACYPIGRQHS